MKRNEAEQALRRFGLSNSPQAPELFAYTSPIPIRYLILCFGLATVFAFFFVFANTSFVLTMKTITAEEMMRMERGRDIVRVHITCDYALGVDRDNKDDDYDYIVHYPQVQLFENMYKVIDINTPVSGDHGPCQSLLEHLTMLVARKLAIWLFVMAALTLFTSFVLGANRMYSYATVKLTADEDDGEASIVYQGKHYQPQDESELKLLVRPIPMLDIPYAILATVGLYLVWLALMGFTVAVTVYGRFQL